MSKQTLIKPGAGQTTQCVVQHGHVYALDFDTSSVMFSRTDGDLRMTFEDGASLVLRDFYNESQIGDFFLELEDGNVLSARSVIESMEYMLDDFVTGASQVYTAESYQSAHISDSVSPSLAIYEEENLPLLSRSGFEAQEQGGPGAEDSIAANGGELTQVADHNPGSAVFDLHMNPETAYAEISLQQAGSGDAEAALADSSQSWLEPGGGLSLAAFVNPLNSDQATPDIITPRAHTEGDVNPFVAYTAAPAGDMATDGGPVLLAQNSKEADLLLLDDLLDTTMPEDMATSSENVPAFEDLFAAVQDDGLAVKINPFAYADAEYMNTVSASDAVADGSEQLLLAFLRMGSF